MPNHTYAQGHTNATIIKGHWLDWYPEIRTLKTMKESELLTDVAAGNLFVKGDIYVRV